jgi:DNA-binding NarL/FixJ family response regulator
MTLNTRSLGLASSLMASPDTGPGSARLTSRETQVLRLLAHGCTYSVVGDRLGVSVNTVTTHVKNIYRKLEVHSAAAAVMRAIELHMLGGAPDARLEHKS